MRRKLVQTGDVDVMLAIRPNFFYTRTVPCELWFYDRGKPAARRDTVLMLDARQVFRKVTRKIFDFSPEQLADLTAVVWLYRGEQARFEALLARHLGSTVQAAQACWQDEGAGLPGLPLDGQVSGPLDEFAAAYQTLRGLMQPFVAALPAGGAHAAVIAEYQSTDADPLGAIEALRLATQRLTAGHAGRAAGMAGSSAFHHGTLLSFADQARTLSGRLDQALRCTLRLLDLAEKQIAARDDKLWPTREIGRARKALEAARGVAVDPLKQVRHFQRHAAWLIDRFPEARYCDVMGLCKAVSRAEIEAADWSLTPGRYVGVAAVAEDEDFDFVSTMGELQNELGDLNRQAQLLSAKIDARLSEIVG